MSKNIDTDFTDIHEKEKTMKTITNICKKIPLTPFIKGGIILILIFFTSQNIFAATNYVSKTGAHVSPFTSWANAATNIQDAVDVAVSNDMVLVNDGIYNNGGGVTPGYSCSNRVVITKDIIVKSVNGPENTIILGKGPRGDSAVRGVYMSAGILDGFTVSNGHTMTSGDYYFDQFGGGTFGGTVNNCTITGNSAANGGGTVFGTVNNSTITGNSAQYGGGTAFGTVNNSTISGNWSEKWGGGAIECTVNNSIISGNSAEYSGGGTHDSTVNNCTINGNSAGRRGGGTHECTVNNSTISGNSASYGGGTSDGNINNSIIYFNYAPHGANFYDCTINYSCSIPLPPGEGNFDTNPLLLSASHISPDSPCVGAGSSDYSIGTDINGEPWKNPPSVGCDEIYPNNLTGDLEVDIYAKYTSAIVGTELEFKSIIVGKPISNYWTFSNGGSVSDNYIVQHSFSSAGEYEVILSAFNLDNVSGVSATVMVNIVSVDDGTFYVNKANTTPSYPYKSWETAATNIQDAVNANYIKRSLVLVTNGVYDSGETVTPNYSCSNRVVITKDITVKSVNGPEKTIILGKGPKGNSAVRGVYMSAGILDGFTVSNGHTMPSGNAYHDRSGGGVNMRGGNGVVTNSTISGNSADGGGGTYYGTVNNCTISGNSAGDAGGGTYWSTVNNCTISGNSAGDDGGGTAFGTVNNSIISGDSAGEEGGGTYKCTVNNSTITGNSAGDEGGGTEDSTINNCIIWGNYAPNGANYYSSTIKYSCTTPLSYGERNISQNPKLIDNVHIATNSPCVGAGSPAFVSGVDIDGDDWANPPAMGCDQPVASICTGNLSVTISAKYNQIATDYKNYFYGSIIGKVSYNEWSFDNGDSWNNTLSGYYSWDAPGTYKVILTAYNDSYPAGISATTIVEVVEKQTHYADKNSSNPVYPYTDLSTAATKIQDAVDAAIHHGDTVLVNDGAYYPGSQISVTQAITVKSINGAENTIVDGSQLHRCFSLNDDSTIDGFTITNGYISGKGGGVIGGIVNNSTISDNSAIQGGGTAFGTVNNSIISGNSAGDGGGGTYYGTVNNCTISGNSAGDDGGGTYNSTVNNSIVSGNSAIRGGGTYYGTVNNCTISGNSAHEEGGGTEDSTVNNCIIWDNYAPNGTNYYINDEYGTINYSCSYPLPTGEGNISVNPQFVSSSDFHLQPTSPCINAGTNGYAPMPFDLDGNPRIVNGIVDMGCYEANSTPASPVFADAATLPSDYGSADGSNTNAITEPGEPAHAGYGPFHSVWWDWKSPGSSMFSMKSKTSGGDVLLVDTHGSDFDTVLAVYTGSVISNLTEIAANDDAGPGTNTSEVIFAFLPDETYHIAVAGKTESDVGNIVLNYEIIPEPGLGIWIIGLLELWIIGKRKLF